MSQDPLHNDTRYPIGKFQRPESISEKDRDRYIETIADAPSRFREAVEGLTAEQLDTPYREGGWTVRQVIHHLPDSHMNAFIRTKLALTEDEPTINSYNETAWARLNDAADTPVETSLTLLEKLHERWVILLRGLAADDWKRQYRHPELGPFSLELMLALYAWHSSHHTAHVTELRKRRGWHGFSR